MDWELWFVIVCAFLSFAFSGAETALSSMGRLEIQKLMSQGGSHARLIQSWVRDPGRVLITVLIGNNIANYAGSSVFALWAVKEYPQYVSFWVASVAIFMIIFAEIMPKLMARQNAVAISPVAMRFLNFVYIAIFPLIWIIQKISAGLVLMSGITGREQRVPVSEEDVTHTIEMATKEGGIDQATGEVLSNLIEFPERLAMHVMTPRSRMSAISLQWSWDQILRFIAADGHSRYPVYQNNLDQIVGVVLVKDLLREVQKPTPGSWTRRIRKPFYVSELVQLGTLLRDMRRWGTHLALVRNESGIFTGLVTLEDLIEEIVGDIRDEHDDPSEAGPDTILGGPRLVNGDIPIVDFNSLFDAGLPIDASFSTLNGYLLSRTGGQLPQPGTLIFDDGLTFRIHSISETGIATVEILDTVVSTGANSDNAE